MLLKVSNGWKNAGFKLPLFITAYKRYGERVCSRSPSHFKVLYKVIKNRWPDNSDCHRKIKRLNEWCYQGGSRSCAVLLWIWID